jgi:hypothetical protein
MLKGYEQMKIPFGSDFIFEGEGIRFRVYYIKNGIKLYTRKGSKTVIEYGNTPHEATEKAKKDYSNAIAEVEQKEKNRILQCSYFV